jgi:hypothetical protein
MADRELSVIHRYRPLVSAYEKIANTYLEERLAEMFTKVEPVMIDFASKAEADNAQTVFFDAIGQIDDKRASVTKAFFKNFKTGFSQFLNGGSIVYPKSIIETDDEKQISLVKDSDLELHIAIQAMITKAKNRNHQDLYQLVQRLSVLRHGKKIAGHDVPACPAHIATTFQMASLDYELEQKLLLILYVLFEKNVLMDIGQLYKQANTLLSEAGIYPHLAPVININNRNSDKPAKALPDTEDASEKKASNEAKKCRTEPLKNEDFELGAEVFSSILTLLTERRRSDPRFKNHPEYLPDGNLEQLRSKSELISALHEVETPKKIDLQIVSSEALSDLQPEERKAAVINSLQNKITDEREVIYRELDTNTIPTADLDTIELVGMLFEHILDDDDLASLTKALICHLHTPYLKLAVIDPTFLTDADHIARKLLNLLVNAGRRWVDENNLNAGIYNSMQKLIQVLMSEFKGDFSIFEHQYAEFMDDLRALEHKTKLLEERTKEATRGRDRLEFSRIHADEVLSAQCAGIEFHPVLNQFIFSLWKNYMTLLLLRNPEIKGGKEWRSVLMVINSIIKANNAPAELETRQWLMHTLPSLKKHIEEGVEFIGTGGEPSEYTQLKALFDEWLSGDIEHVANIRSEKAVKSASPVVKKSASKKKNARVPSAKQKAVMETIQQTKIGSWFEFNEPDGKLQRVKLSWYSPVTNNHMFIDRFGNKAFILPTEVLVDRLSNGTARIIDPNRFPFVDQSLKKIYSMLRT